MDYKTKIRTTVDYYKSQNVVFVLNNGQEISVGIHDTDENNAICIPHALLQQVFDGKRTLSDVLANEDSYLLIPFDDIHSIKV